MDNIPNYEPTDGEGLFRRNGAEFFRITPAKGARAEGVVSVGMTYAEVLADSSRPYGEKILVPEMWVDFTPNYADDSYSPSGGRSRQTMTVNGKEYGEGFAASVSGRVEFIPAKGNEHRATYYPKVTVGDVEYLMWGKISAYDAVSDAARKTLLALAEKIAAEYVTAERWHATRVSIARRRHTNAVAKLAEAQAEVDAAQTELDTLTN